MLLHTLLAQERLQDLSVNGDTYGYDTLWAVVGGVSDVCIHHEIFSDSDLELFFDDIYMWMGRIAGRREYVVERFMGRGNVAFTPAAETSCMHFSYKFVITLHHPTFHNGSLSRLVSIIQSDPHLSALRLTLHPLPPPADGSCHSCRLCSHCCKAGV
ncbi:hypothetical protein BD779DRAFT_1581783 [Infundibulicybe gibba]|nr:hypothetical protein BD779DRAFT_1581783 [Infundibulicybe gibba]